MYADCWRQIVILQHNGGCQRATPSHSFAKEKIAIQAEGEHDVMLPTEVFVWLCLAINFYMFLKELLVQLRVKHVFGFWKNPCK